MQNLKSTYRSEDNEMVLTGRITSWLGSYGFIAVRQRTTLGRYYLHISNIVFLAEELDFPAVDCVVTFEPSDAARRSPKDLPGAINAEVHPPMTAVRAGLGVLAGKAVSQ